MTFNPIKLHYEPFKNKFLFLSAILTIFKIVTFSADYYMNGRVNVLADFIIYTALQGLIFGGIWEVIS